MSKTLVIHQDQLQATVLEAVTILQKLRFYKQRFEKNHDADTKHLMKTWEGKADVFLRKLTIEEE